MSHMRQPDKTLSMVKMDGESIEILIYNNFIVSPFIDKQFE